MQRLQVSYDPEIHTYERAKADAVKLYDAGEGRWGTDETTFIRILFSSPREHLVLVNDIYKKKYVSDLEEAVRAEFSGYATEALVFYGACGGSVSRWCLLQFGLLATICSLQSCCMQCSHANTVLRRACCAAVRLALEPVVAIADHFERTMKGLGTDEKGLSAAVIRYHWMQPRVEKLYEKLYRRSLEERIRTDTDANYGDLLVTLLHIPTGSDSDEGISSTGSSKAPEPAS
ncbi:unnamed protein product [Phytophthora fragariaefolia]|uniref:Unnamed protein product n=1 Tax=Phytophthora fragariaefolia TaxID=1490495 RepID=A0A9W7D549_9STRA|nr:unnamed protein product [Phytophthora fragariaefolia]